MKYFLIAFCCLSINLTFGQTVSMDETVRYINELLNCSKSTTYKYQITLSSDGLLDIIERSIETKKITFYINDLDVAYISKDWETCTFVRKNGDSKHIQLWCKNKSDCINCLNDGVNYTCETHIYIDLSDYDSQRLLNAFNYLISEGEKSFASNRNKINDPFAPKAGTQSAPEKLIPLNKSVSKKESTNMQSTTSCNVKTINRPDGVVVRYLNPELVGKGNTCEFGLSVQTNGDSFFLTTTARYFGASKKMIGDLKIQLSNDQALVLKLYSSELATAKNVQVGLSIFYLTTDDVQKLKNATIKTVVFQEIDKKYQIVTLNQNFDVAQRHLRCLQ